VFRVAMDNDDCFFQSTSKQLMIPSVSRGFKWTVAGKNTKAPIYILGTLKLQ